MMKILVTGGAGYIGSHTTLSLLLSGFEVVVLDNLSNCSYESLNRVSKLASKKPVFYEGDVRNPVIVNQIFQDHTINAVIHFAGLKAVGESVRLPLAYFDNNVHGSQVLLQAMLQAGVYNLVFSSSATVYGQPSHIPIPEDHPFSEPTSPYGRSKIMVEGMLRDLSSSDSRWNIAILRYFNPVGAHESGMIGEHPKGVPNNLMPYLTQVAIGALPELIIYGNDYPTRDGTGIRDYIHVVDLAEGHLSALEAITSQSGLHVWNLGTGQGYSVLDMLKAFQIIIGRQLPYRFDIRRPGDIAVCYADPSKAIRELKWSAKRDASVMLRDAWRWQQGNPNGYS